MKGIVGELVSLVGGQTNGHHVFASNGNGHNGRQVLQTGVEKMRQVISRPRPEGKLLDHGNGNVNVITPEKVIPLDDKTAAFQDF